MRPPRPPALVACGVAALAVALSACGADEPRSDGDESGGAAPSPPAPDTVQVEVRGVTVGPDDAPVPECAVIVTAAGPDAPELPERASVSSSEGVWLWTVPAGHEYAFEASCPDPADPEATLTGALRTTVTEDSTAADLRIPVS